MSKYKKEIKVINKLLGDQFQRELLKACFDNLLDKSNKLCFNNFAYSIRELTTHYINWRAPDKEVETSPWFDINDCYIENGKSRPSRRQKIKYIIQGVLEDSFVDSQILSLSEVAEVQESILGAYKIFNKYTHISKKTLGINEELRDDLVDEITQAFIDLTYLLEKYHQNFITKATNLVSDDIYSQFIQDTYDKIDELSTHHSIESVDVSSISVETIATSSITFILNGNIEVRLQWGSDGDIRRGDGHEQNENFSFKCQAIVELDAMSYSNIDIKDLEIDTDEY